MKIFHNTNISKLFKGSALAIGNFDGVHRGHRKVFNKAKKFAKKNKIRFGVLTFDPLPKMFFNKNILNYKLLSNEQKYKLLKKYGVDFVVCAKFNKSFSKISPKKFITNIIYKKINPKFIFVSNNFKFGYKRKGNINLLKRFSKKCNFNLKKVDPLKYRGGIISSTRIRKYISKGNIEKANRILSRTWSIDGKVIKGKKLGRELGYRTCNIYIKKYVLPKTGIYSVKVFIKKLKKIYGGIAYLGDRPTFGGKRVFLEVNIFNINKNLYTKTLRVYFLKFIRKDQKFSNSAKLIKQMNKDVILAKKGLKTKLVI